MAVTFVLAVNFGTDQAAADAAIAAVRQRDSLELRGVCVPLVPMATWLGDSDRYLELAVWARGLGAGAVSGSLPGLEARSLTAAEITKIGDGLYGLLREFSGYRAAIVGWNPESLVDVDDLELTFLAGDTPDHSGLVLSHELCDRWHLSADWVPFDDDRRWLPHAGWKNLW